MKRFKNISIRYKLLIIILIITLPILIGQTIYNINQEGETLRENMKATLSTAALLTAEYCANNLLFNDREAATQSIHKLSNIAHVQHVKLFDTYGSLFAEYQKPLSSHTMKLTPIKTRLSKFADNQLYINELIYHNKEIIGSISIIASTNELSKKINRQTQYSITILIGLIIIIVVISLQLQRLISEPILNLTRISRKVAESGNYSLRGEKTTTDEISELVNGFNQMLDKIETTTFSKNYVDNIIGSMLEPLFVVKKGGNIIQTNASAQQMLGYSEKALFEMNINNLVKNPKASDHDAEFTETFIKSKNGTSIPISFSASELDRNTMVCVAHDLTHQKAEQSRISASLKEKEVMIQEIHHRVKNNLQVISSLLNLQADYIENPEVREIFGKSQNRIRSMALIHSKLYQSKDLVHIDIGDYMETLASDIVKTYEIKKAVDLHIDTEVREFNINAIVPLALMLNEFITNSLKYAFQNSNSGAVYISLHHIKNGYYKLTISDNGVGIPTNLDWKKTTTLGMQLIQMLVEQLDGEIAHDTKFKGTKFEVTFPSNN